MLDLSQDVARTSARRHFDLFDSLRAIAVLCVVGTHVLVSSGRVAVGSKVWEAGFRLNVGVTIFFVISGFLLYRPFVAARYAGRGLPSVPVYAGRRILRIVPAYWLAVTVLALWPGLKGVLDGHSFWVYYGFLQIYGLGPHNGGIYIVWSLCIEMAFYAALPVIAWVIARAARRPDDLRADVVGLGALLALAIGMRLALVADDYHHPALWLSLPGRMDWFIPGMAMAVASVRLEGREEQSRGATFIARFPLLPWLAAIGIFAVLAFEMGTVPFIPTWQVPLETLAYAAIAFLVVIPAVFGEHAGGLPRRILALPGLLWLGLISYGIFLWHYPLALEFSKETKSLAATAALTLGVSIACAAASWYLLERPILRWGRRTVDPLLRGETRVPAVAAEHAAAGP